jgi:transposase-like protein
VPIGRFQGLVEPLGYVRSRLSEESRKIIRLEYRRGASVAKLADEWDVSESLIRTILQGDKPPVSPLEKAINKGVSEPEPPLSGRVAKIKGGLTRVK